MSFSGAKYPTISGNPTPFETLLPVLIINDYPQNIDINSVKLINGIDDPVIDLVAGTGYESNYPIPAPGTGNSTYGKGFANVQNVPSVIRINYSASVPSAVPLTVTVYGHTITTSSPGTVAGTFNIDIPVDLRPGDIARIRLYPE